MTSGLDESGIISLPSPSSPSAEFELGELGRQLTPRSASRRRPSSTVRANSLSLPSLNLPRGVTDISPSEKKPTPPLTPPPLYDPKTLCWIAVFSWIGCVVRLGLSTLFNYDGEGVFPLIWSQGLGCFIMGVLVIRKMEVERLGGAGLYIGLGTGLCGSITTFSTWMLDTFEAFSNLPGYDRSGVHDATAGLTIIIQTIAFSLFSLALGFRLASIFSLRAPSSFSFSTSTTSLLALLLYAFTFLVYLGLLLSLLLTTTKSFRVGRRVVLSLLIAPPGSFVRWWFARLLNAPLPSRPFPSFARWFPPTLGTLLVNALGTAIIATISLLQRVQLDNGGGDDGLSVFQCGALQAVKDGFCGSLTTVSTFTLEIDVLLAAAAEGAIESASGEGGEGGENGGEGEGEGEGVRQWVPLVTYLFGSVLLGQVLVVLILGVGWWASPEGAFHGAECRY